MAFSWALMEYSNREEWNRGEICSDDSSCELRGQSKTPQHHKRGSPNCILGCCAPFGCASSDLPEYRTAAVDTFYNFQGNFVAIVEREKDPVEIFKSKF